IDKRTVHPEFQDLGIVPEARRPRKLPVEVACLTVAGHIYEVVMVDIDSVLTRWPDASVCFPAFLVEGGIGGPPPCRHQVSGFVELQYGGRRHATSGQLPVGPTEPQRSGRFSFVVLSRDRQPAAVGRTQGARTMVDPDVIVSIDVQASHVAD